MLYGILCQMLPDANGIVNFQMHRRTFTMSHVRDEKINTLRRQNWPFRFYPVEFIDPTV